MTQTEGGGANDETGYGGILNASRGEYPEQMGWMSVKNNSNNSDFSRRGRCGVILRSHTLDNKNGHFQCPTIHGVEKGCVEEDGKGTN